MERFRHVLSHFDNYIKKPTGKQAGWFFFCRYGSYQSAFGFALPSIFAPNTPASMLFRSIPRLLLRPSEICAVVSMMLPEIFAVWSPYIVI